MKAADELRAHFDRIYGAPPRIFRAPGRVNLIGEHTDYNQGWVMPAAIGFATRVAIGPAPGRILSVHSEHFSETVQFDLDEPDPKRRGHWSDYVRGVAVVLERAGHRLCAANMVIGGNVPLGSGLSSSASLEVATALALLQHSGWKLDPMEIALLCQRAENEFVGARVGIMDQFTACFGMEDRAILLDCRSLEAQYLPLPHDVRLVVANTMVRHALASGEYNRRRMECEEGVRVLSQFLPDIQSLRDVTPEQVEQFRNKLDPVIFRRCRHVTTENQRVLSAAGALRENNLGEFGRLMLASHRSLRDDYEVSCPELDVMVELASCSPGVYGSRMTGGGFGGCTISLVEAAHTAAFSDRVAEGYLQKTGIRGEIYVCSAVNGAGEEPV